MQDLFDIRRERRVSIERLCVKYDLNSRVVFAMLRNQPITRDQAEKVLSALSKDLNQTFTLDTVLVNLVQ